MPSFNLKIFPNYYKVDEALTGQNILFNDSRKHFVAQIDFRVAGSECDLYEYNRNRSSSRGINGSLCGFEQINSVLFKQTSNNVVLVVHNHQAYRAVSSVWHCGDFQPCFGFEYHLSGQTRRFLEFIKLIRRGIITEWPAVLYISSLYTQHVLFILFDRAVSE